MTMKKPQNSPSVCLSVSAAVVQQVAPDNGFVPLVDDDVRATRSPGGTELSITIPLSTRCRHCCGRGLPSISKTNVARALLGCCIVSAVLVFVVLSYQEMKYEPMFGVSRVELSERLSKIHHRTSFTTALLQVVTALLGADPDFENRKSILVDNGGTGWKVKWTEMIGKRFFGIWSWQYIPSAQGMSLLPSGKSLVFSGRYVLRRTQSVFPFATEAVLPGNAIPEQFASAAGGGYDHIGDISTVVHEGEEVVLASIEEPSFSKPLLVVLNASDLAFQWSCPLHQRHTSLVAIDRASMIVHSTEFRDVTEVKRYRFPTCEEVEPLKLKRDGAHTTLQGVQGGAVHDGTLYLTTNQIPSNRGNIFGVNLQTGDIDFAMNLVMGDGHAETEGLDVSMVDGRLRMLVAMNYFHLFSGVTLLELE